MFSPDFDMPGGPQFGGPNGYRFGGPRIGRGMMEPLILYVLTEKPMHGYEVISTIEDKSHGMWHPSAGSVYPTLQLLDEKGYVTLNEEGGKKIYALTDEGREAAGKNNLFDQLWNFGHDRNSNHNPHHDHHARREHREDMRAMRETLGGAMKDMRIIFRNGNETQKQQLLQTLEHLKQELHTIVENEPTSTKESR